MSQRQAKTEAEIHHRYLQEEKKKAGVAEKKRKGLPKTKTPIISLIISS